MGRVMQEDSVLKEVHKAKDELGAKYDYDIMRMAAAFRENQRKRGRKVAGAPVRARTP